MVLTYGIMPQTVVCDRANRLEALNDIANGTKKLLNPKTPNLDLWKLVVRAIFCRGSLRECGPDQLWTQWLPVQTRASRSETTEQRTLRRGNDAADYFANEGHKVHNDVGNKITRAKYVYHVAKKGELWLGKAAALQYASNFEGCDHDVKTNVSKNHIKGKKHTVDLPH